MNIITAVSPELDKILLEGQGIFTSVRESCTFRLSPGILKRRVYELHKI